MNRRGFLRAIAAAAVAIPLAPLLPKTPATAWRANVYPLGDMGIVSQRRFLESYGLYFNDYFINGDAAEERFIARMRWPVGLVTFDQRSVARLTRTIDQ